MSRAPRLLRHVRHAQVGRESRQRAGGDASQERRLADAVAAQLRVAPTRHQPKFGAFEQCPTRERQASRRRPRRRDSSCRSPGSAARDSAATGAAAAPRLALRRARRPRAREVVRVVELLLERRLLVVLSYDGWGLRPALAAALFGFGGLLLRRAFLCGALVATLPGRAAGLLAR